MFDALKNHFGAEPDRRGECPITCPECGKESSQRNVHCSFSEKGYKCFVCGAGGSLKRLAEMVNMDTRDYKQQQQKPKRTRRTPEWLSVPAPYVSRYESHSRRFELWDDYKPLPSEIIERKRLGVGVLPSSRCKHERLIVPVIAGTMIVGLRGRAIDCDCGKWLQAGGTTMDRMPLYNVEDIQYDNVIWIVENPIDALMVSAYTNSVGVATYSVSYWHDNWTRELVDAEPKRIYIAYDNDAPGNGGAWRREEVLREWRKTHNADPPEPGGIKLANRLSDAGLPVKLHDWKDAPFKADIGSLLMEAQNARV